MTDNKPGLKSANYFVGRDGERYRTAGSEMVEFAPRLRPKATREPSFMDMDFRIWTVTFGNSSTWSRAQLIRIEVNSAIEAIQRMNQCSQTARIAWLRCKISPVNIATDFTSV